MPPCPPRTMVSGSARKGFNAAIMWSANQPPPSATTLAAAVREAIAARSGVLTTSPRSRACWSLRDDGSSVRDAPSFVSLMASSEHGDEVAVVVDPNHADDAQAEGEDPKAQQHHQGGGDEDELGLRHHA